MPIVSSLLVPLTVRRSFVPAPPSKLTGADTACPTVTASFPLPPLIVTPVVLAPLIVTWSSASPRFSVVPGAVLVCWMKTLSVPPSVFTTSDSSVEYVLVSVPSEIDPVFNVRLSTASLPVQVSVSVPLPPS